MRLKVLALTAAASLAFAGIGFAASPAIEQAKSQCVVGEQADGYLGVVEGQRIGEELRREVRENNQQRKAIYADFAARNSITIETAAAIFAERQVNAAPSGQCVRDPNGVWLRKP